jgi:integrase
MLTRMRYVTRRISPKGKERWYWQRPGHKLVRLPDDPAERFAKQERLNKAADGKVAPAEKLPHGSIGWLIALYRASDAYRDLAPGTKRYYETYIGQIERIGPRDPFADLDRELVVDFIEAYPKAHQRRKAAAVFKKLVGIARYRGLIENNPADELGLKTSPSRDRVWSADEIASWLDSAKSEDPHMTTAFLLLQFTAQRPGDVLAMTWRQYDGQTIRLKQHKTAKLVEVPVHPDLKEHLDGARRTAMMIVAFRGKPVPYLRFNERFRRVCRRAKTDAQARDLRRTAMLRMAEAGATTPQIASVSGHSIDQTQRILETYLPRTRELAQAAITKLSEHKGRKV